MTALVALTVKLTLALSRWRRGREHVKATPLMVYETTRGGGAIHYFKKCKALERVMRISERNVCLHCAREHADTVDAVFEGAKRSA